MIDQAVPPMDPAIGGYFGLDLPFLPCPFGPLTAFQSARAAFHAVFDKSTFRRVFIPSYICNSVIMAAENAGLMVDLYELDEGFMPKHVPHDLEYDTGIVYVNYFGLSDANVVRVVERFGTGKVLIDQSQALFAEPSGARADIYSPRKFAGLPDGGWVRPVSVVSEPILEDDGSIDRMRHLARRMAYSAREGYADFNAVRLTLSDTSPMRMSRLTRRLLHAVDWGHVARQRRSNYLHMSRRLDGMNARPWFGDLHAVPLCYPFSRLDTDMGPVRQELADRHDIFCAMYWPDVLGRTKVGSIEEMMIRNTLFLPIDQRLNKGQLDTVCDAVLDLLNRT